MRSHPILRIVVLIVSYTVASISLAAQVPNRRPEIGRNLEILDSIYCKIVGSYVEEVDPAAVMKIGAKAMLASLDPFSVYYDRQETEEVKLAQTARYGGIGCVFAPAGDKIWVSRVREGYSGFRAGIRPGDTILSIDHSPIAGKSLDEVIGMVRGTPGTAITIGFQHMGQRQVDTATLGREEIKIKAVDYFGMLDGHVGYIRLLRESKNSSEEVKAALKDLKAGHTLKGLIFDLRNNEGGYVSEANKITNFFLDKGDTLLSERSARDTLHSVSIATDSPVDRNTQMIVLVNGNTISAGEVISGALQDHDRAVIMGERTFGKGLVQQVYNLPFQTLLTLTSEYYYTPSGRCIESAQYSGIKAANAGISERDSLKKMYRTKDGRIVYSYGGIDPDIRFASPRPAPIVEKLIQDDLFFSFAMQYKATHPRVRGPKDFHLDAKDYDEFVHSLRARNIGYQTRAGKKLQELKDAAVSDGLSAEINAAIGNLQVQLANWSNGALDRYSEEIRAGLEAEIVSVYYFETGRAQYQIQKDPEVKRAAELVSSDREYRKILIAIR